MQVVSLCKIILIVLKPWLLLYERGTNLNDGKKSHGQKNIMHIM
jgi:hypothetical protein